MEKNKEKTNGFFCDYSWERVVLSELRQCHPKWLVNVCATKYRWRSSMLSRSLNPPHHNKSSHNKYVHMSSQHDPSGRTNYARPTTPQGHEQCDCRPNANDTRSTTTMHDHSLEIRTRHTLRGVFAWDQIEITRVVVGRFVCSINT